MTLRDLSENGPAMSMVVGLTVDQYHRMIASGILPEGEPIELLDGLLVRKDRSARGENPMTVGHHHAWVVDQLAELNEQLKRHQCFIRIQQPITVQPDNEPEPDGAIVGGSTLDYRDSHPSSGDVLSVFEVADSSVNRDRTTKQRIYAEAGIAHYVLINLADGIIEVRTTPLSAEGRYANTAILNRGQTLAISMTDGAILNITVDALLP
jgi:Uma2 family endonuclease